MRSKLLYLILCATLLAGCHSASRWWIIGGQHKEYVQNNPIAAVVLSQPTQTLHGKNGSSVQLVTFLAQAHDVQNRENSFTFVAVCTLEITADCMALSPTSTLDVRQWRVLDPIGEPGGTSATGVSETLAFPRPCPDHLHHGDLHGCHDPVAGCPTCEATYVTIEISRIKDLKH